jgi:integrase
MGFFDWDCLGKPALPAGPYRSGLDQRVGDHVPPSLRACAQRHSFGALPTACGPQGIHNIAVFMWVFNQNFRLYTARNLLHNEDMQSGNLRKRHGSWQLRYYVLEIGPDNKPVRRQVTKVIARANDQYRTQKDCEHLVKQELERVNRSAHNPQSGLTVSEFFDREFTSNLIRQILEGKKTASTARFYAVTFNLYIRNRIGHIRLRDFATLDAQRVLDDISGLSQQSLLRIKTTMSAIFSYAIRLGYVTGQNPVREAKAQGIETDPIRYAYTLDEIQFILGKLSEPARTACAVAAFAGLRESEIRGLKWEDYTGDFLLVRRSIWRTHVADRGKTKASRDKVPVIAPLRKLLNAHKQRANGHSWIFAGEKKGFSLNLDNLARREIRPVLKSHWHGWHAFRRGLSTNLFELGVPAEVAQVILRHADASTTRKHYLVLESRKAGAAAMRKLERVIGNVGQKWAKPKAKSGKTRINTR